jgi:integrase
LTAGTVRIRRKGGAVQDLPLHPTLVAELRAWGKGATRGPLFPGGRGGALSDEGISEMFRTFAQGELQIMCTGHQLRPTFATTLSCSGADLKDIQRLLGHASVKTTEIYVEPDDRSAAQALQLLPSSWGQLPSLAVGQSEAQDGRQEPGPSRRASLRWAALLLLLVNTNEL